MFHSIERTISQISAHFVGVLDPIEGAIDEALSLLGASCNASRAYIFLFDELQLTMSNVFEWCSIGVTPEKDNLQNLTVDIFPWWMSKLRNNELILVENVDEMGDEAVEERSILKAQDIKSVAVMPLIDSSGLIGFVGLDNVEASLLWSNEEVALLKMASELLGNAFTRLRYEKELKESNNALIEAIDRRNKLQAKLIQREKMAGIGVLVAGLAHEINNPLGYIMSNVNVMKTWAHDGVPSLDYDDFAELIDETEAGLKRISNIISGLMHFTQSDVSVINERVYLSDLIEEALLLIGEILMGDIQVDYSKTKGILIVCKHNEMNQVFMNILMNAVQAINDKHPLSRDGRITIWANVLNEQISIFISDNGTGIPPGVIDNIFDPFFTTRPEGLGTGLGLSEAYQIVEKMHGGELFAINNQDDGATFIITLPLPLNKGEPVCAF